MKEWSLYHLENMIENGVEESLTIEYKASEALDKSDKKKTEITKDISAMANSSGGTIFYGIKEYSEKEKSHLPEKIDPINRNDFTKEWIEHITNNIKPRIDGIVITPVKIGDDNCVYVIDIPQSNTAHQAMDLRYYKRYNFECVPMHDYEIRDVMSRLKYPKIEVAIKIYEGEKEGSVHVPHLNIDVTYTNVGQIYAKYVNGFIYLLEALEIEDKEDYKVVNKNEINYYKIDFQNLHKDLIGMKEGSFYGSGPGIKIIPYFITRHDPLLPGLSKRKRIKLYTDMQEVEKFKNETFYWYVNADNAPPQTGSVKICDCL